MKVALRLTTRLSQLILAGGLVFLGACNEDEPIPEGHFPCGNAGSCERGTEVCAENGGCFICLEAPPSCEEDETCGCLDDAEDSTLISCAVGGTCEADGDGHVLVCGDEPEFGCG